MNLGEQHIIKQNDIFYKECDDLCFKSKNLYNSCLYIIRQEYLNNKNNVLYNLHHLMKNTEQYKSLPSKVSSSVLNNVQLNFKSFFNSLKSYKKNPKLFKNRPQLPKYLDKENGRFFVSYTNQAISKKIFKKSNKIKLSQSNIEFKTKIKDFKNIDCVKIIPNIGYYIIEVIYTINIKEKLSNNNRYIGIDLGVSNLATLTTNIKEIKPIIINGKPLKSINQYYNKKRSEISSILEKRNKNKKSKRLNILTLKRKNKIDNFLHKSSKYIVNYCIENQVNTIIVGKNDGWKNECNMSKQNNQNFISIPYSRFINMIKYKCEIEGIKVITINESYTSKCSFLDLEDIKKQEIYKGKRIKRGLFKSSNGTLINADVNGSYNILRKVVPNVFSNGIEDFRVNPLIIKIIK